MRTKKAVKNRRKGFSPSDTEACLHENFYSLSRKIVSGDSDIKKKLMDILACPIDKHHPLELLVFEEKDEIVEGLIICPKCLRWYPIRDEIPEMLPDELRKEVEDLPFLRKWKERVPERILLKGNPFNIKDEVKKSST